VPGWAGRKRTACTQIGEARDAASDTGGLTLDLTIKERRLADRDRLAGDENDKDRVLRLRSENILE
jgi:hypothetical protein